jgi:hypothetical protein
MNEVELRPGQKITLILQGTISTPLGERTQETSETLSYEELLSRLQNKTSKSWVPRVPKEIRGFNRFAALSQTAIEDGTWSTGAAVDRNKILNDLLTKVKALPQTVYSHVSDKAKKHLEEISGNKLLKPDQKKELKEFLTKVSKPLEKTA